MSKYFRYEEQQYNVLYHRLLVKSVGECLICSKELEYIPTKKGIHKPRSNLALHHINADKSDYNLYNLSILCHGCHIRLGHKDHQSFRPNILIFSLGHLDELLLEEKPLYRKNYKKIRQMSKKVYNPNYYKLKGEF